MREHGFSLSKRAVAEMLGTAGLVAAVVGSGIMAERLSGGNVAIALLANTIATAAALLAIILTLGGISGAHLNPVVSLADAMAGGLRWGEVAVYSCAQIAGGVCGVMVANLMFGLRVVAMSQHVRSGWGQGLGEFVATFGLLAVIWGASRTRAESTPVAVAAYIAGAYWFTSSTSFANPAVTIARCLTDTFAGIRAGDVPMFVLAQIFGAVTATLLFAWLVPVRTKDANLVEGKVR